MIGHSRIFFSDNYPQIWNKKHGTPTYQSMRNYFLLVHSNGTQKQKEKYKHKVEPLTCLPHGLDQTRQTQVCVIICI